MEFHKTALLFLALSFSFFSLPKAAIADYACTQMGFGMLWQYAIAIHDLDVRGQARVGYEQYLANNPAACSAENSRLQTDIEKPKAMPKENLNSLFLAPTPLSEEALEAEIVNFSGGTSTGTETSTVTSTSISTAPATHTILSPPVSVKLALDVTFSNFEDCTSKMADLSEKTTAVCAAGFSNMQKIDDANAYCRALFPETGGIAPPLKKIP
jgi:hypothetical protein